MLMHKFEFLDSVLQLKLSIKHSGIVKIEPGPYIIPISTHLYQLETHPVTVQLHHQMQLHHFALQSRMDKSVH